MSHSQPGPIRRFFGGIWNTVNFARRLVFNILFLLVLFLLLVAILANPGVQPLEEKTALVST